MNSQTEEKKEVPASSPQIENSKAPMLDNHHRSYWLKVLTLVLVCIALAVFVLWFFYFRFYESTDDAYGNGDKISLNSAVSGSVVTFFADDTDLVEEGQLLVLLDTTYYQIDYEKQLANLAVEVLNVKQLFDQVNVKKHARESKLVALNKARYDYDNRSKLVGSLAISNEDYTHSKDSFNQAEQDFEMAEWELKSALDAVGNTAIFKTTLEDHPLIQKQIKLVLEAFYKLKRCEIYAPSAGYIAERSVDVGQWVEPGSPLLSIIPTQHVWVDANFKETQLTNMRVGQPAIVTFDIYGSSVKYEGKVLGIPSGTGSIFSLIPPQNATGNWIKIVQRLPVRISLDPEKVKQYPVRLGLSAYVDVDISDKNLPMLVQNPSKKPVAMTDVFHMNFDEAMNAIEKIVYDSHPQNSKFEGDCGIKG